MHKTRIVVLALIALVAAIAAYVLWPSGLPDQNDQTGQTDQPGRSESPPSSEAHGPVVPVAPAAPSSIKAPSSDAPDDPVTVEDAQVPPEDPSDEPITSVACLTLPFFDDLAQRLVDRYHPAGSKHNPTDQGLFTPSLSALNRAYGVEMIGLEHEASSILQAREQIFDALLRPDVVDAAADAFSAYFQQALIDQALAAKRNFASKEKEFVQRSLSVPQVAEFLRLASSFMRKAAQAVHVYVHSEHSVAQTEAWQDSRRDALAANARYQKAQDLLRNAMDDAPEDRKKIEELRLEREAASQEILETIATREHLKGVLLARFEQDTLTRDMFSGDLLYVCEWLGRRLIHHPERKAAFSALSAHAQDFADQLHKAAEAVAASAPE